MIERSNKTSKSSKRRNRVARVNKKRRLTMEGLEARQLLAAEVFLPDVDVPFYSAPRNVGSVPAAQYFESEVIGQSNQNDYFNNADFIPLGTAPGQQDTIDVTGSMVFGAQPNDPFSFVVDIDTFSFDLRAGDILDISTFGAAGTIDVFYENGYRWFGTDQSQAIGYPANSPLQTLGNAVAAMVVPEDGRYFLTVSPTTTLTNYQLGLRAYRPVVEELPVGAQQVIFLDFDGGFYPRTIFDSSGIPQPGVIRVPSLQESLPFLGIQIQDEAGLNELIDKTVAGVERQFNYLAENGNAGDYNATGNIGDYAVTILNSRDHADPGQHPLVTRVLIGGDDVNAEVPSGVLGVSSTLDVGNFSMDDIVFALTTPILPAPVPIAPTASELDYAADILATVASHEAVHSFGMRHTDENNGIATIVDAVVNTNEGPDGIYGTLDDVDVDFIDDQFRPIEGFFGIFRTTDGLANTLRSGRQSGGVSGTIFSDANRDGRFGNEAGLAGFTIFADINSNGQLDATEPVTTSAVDGRYTLNVRPGTYDVVAVPREGFASTTTNPRRTTVSSGRSSSGVNFGFNQVLANVTGTAFVDSDGDGIRDEGEAGLEGVYVYIDLDGDDRPDLGEPGANTGEDGTYAINFPGEGIYTLRSDLGPGFERTFPEDGEHTVFFDGDILDDNYDFGFLPSQDFGDAPNSYLTTVDVDGAAHGITSGLTIGSVVDREIDGLPGSSANGDDLDDLIDDEDGVRQTSQLGPGATGTFEVTVNNETASNAYLQAFVDVNRDGFFGSNEQFATNELVAAGTENGKIIVSVPIPANVDPGTTYARFRLSQTAGLGSAGFASSGEVEDYAVTILTGGGVANDDEYEVPRNSPTKELEVLANDFQTPENPLTIETIRKTDASGVETKGQVVLSGGRIFYTPPSNFVGRTGFAYTVTDTFGNPDTAEVVVDVLFQTETPIAVDDVFEVPEGSSNRALNVLDNDVASINGGLSITSVTGGSNGGTLTIVGGGQSLRYTPLPGFAGTEQFTYTIQDGAGNPSSAIGTINLLPGSRQDDIVEYIIEVLDTEDLRPITHTQVNQDVIVRVSVKDLRDPLFTFEPGVFSGFLDLLYTNQLLSVATVGNGNNNPDISFGPIFAGLGITPETIETPGLVNEVGGVQKFLSIEDLKPHERDPVTGEVIPDELFSIRMNVLSPGIAVFQADPADAATSETLVLNSNPEQDSDIALTVNQLLLSRAELTILPESDDFTSAVDDSFPEGLDSDGNLIIASSTERNRLDVLRNDNLGPTGTIREFGLVTAPSLGNVFIDDNGTPSDKNDDFLSYRANVNANGLDTFSYVIVTDDNIRSTAEVTVAVGNQNLESDVAFDFRLVSGDGSNTPISSVGVNDRFGVEIHVEDLRVNPTFVFAGYMDLLYDSGIIAPADTNPNDEFNFDVVFGENYSTDAGVGTAARDGIIDEFGTLFKRATVPPSEIPSLSPGLLATVYFNALSVGTADVVGSPADASPFQDTLLFGEDDPVDRSRIRFETFEITVGSGGSTLQNRALPQDVNNDGSVSPLDALLIINQMKRESIEAEGESAPQGSLASEFYTDVNGDSVTSALDALQVINYLKRQTDSAGNGEQIALLDGSTPTAPADNNTDDVFATLGGESAEKIVSTDTTVEASAEQLALIAGVGADDDDDDDVLSLLADDITGIWS